MASDAVRSCAFPEQGNAAGDGRLAQFAVQRGKRQSQAQGQFEIARVVDGEAVMPGQHHDGRPVGIAIEFHRQSCDTVQEERRIGLAQAAAPLVDDERVAQLEPPQGWGSGLGCEQLRQGLCRQLMGLVLQSPAERNRRIHDKGHQYENPSVFVALVPGR
jgi:hypothetical protein